MEIIKKYWWCFMVALIGVPIALNFVLLIPAFTPIVGDNQVWLSFIGTLIGALASFAMVFFTAKTLEQNNQQLKEMKRQWDEEHMPYVACELSPSDESCCLRLHVINYSNVIADNVKIRIINNLYYPNGLNNECTLLNKDNHDKIFDYIYSQCFTLAPQGSVYINLDIPGGDLEPFPHLITLEGFLDVTIETSKSPVRNFKLYPSNFQLFSK